MRYKSYYWSLIAFTSFIYAIGYLFELDASSLDGAFMAFRLQFFGGSFTSILVYLFTRDFSGRPIKNKWQVAMLFVVPAIALFSANLYPDSVLIFKSLNFVQEPVPHLIIKQGILYIFFAFYNIAVSILSFYEIIMYFPRKTKADRKKRWVFGLVYTVPFIAIMITYNSPSRVNMQWISSLIVFFIMLLAIYISRSRREDWLPHAREQIFEYINDGYVLIDNNEKYADANNIAKIFFPALQDTDQGTDISEVEGFPLEVLKLHNSFMDIPVTVNDEDKILRCFLNIIVHENITMCKCLIFYDATQLINAIDELELKATHDALTNLYNRGSFFEYALRDFDLHIRTKTPATLMMIDIDFFKSVNDKYGHQTGDKVLREVSAIILGRLRRTDIAGRYGGEEFCVYLAATPLENAILLANDIRILVESKIISVGGKTFSVTVSIGLSELEMSKHHSLEELIAFADKALYEAKNSGRNKVMVG